MIQNMDENVSNITGERTSTSSPLNLVWGDVDPLGLDFDIREGALSEHAHTFDSSDLLKLGSLEAPDITIQVDGGTDGGGAGRRKKRRQQAPAKSTRSKKPNGKPKRPLTAQMCLFEELKAKEQREKGHIDFQTLRMVAQERWLNMGEEQRRRYEQQAAEDRKRFRDEMKNFTEMQPKKRAKHQNEKTPACPSPSPENTPVINKAVKILEPSRVPVPQVDARAPASFPGPVANTLRNEVPARYHGQTTPSSYNNSIRKGHPSQASAVAVPPNNGSSSHVLPSHQTVQVLPSPPPRNEVSPAHYGHGGHHVVEDRLLRTAPPLPNSSSAPLHAHAHPPDPQTHYSPTRPRVEQRVVSPPTLLRPKMEILLNGPDGVARKYILHYKCYSVKRDEVPAFIESLNPHGPPGIPMDRGMGPPGPPPPGPTDGSFPFVYNQSFHPQYS